MMKKHGMAMLTLVVAVGLGCGDDQVGDTTTSEATGSGSATTSGTGGTTGGTTGDTTGDTTGATTGAPTTSEGTSSTGLNSGGESTSSGEVTGESATTEGDSESGTDTDPGTESGGLDCDYQVDDKGVLMFEGESLPIVEAWTIDSAADGFLGEGYVFWSGRSFNGQPGNGPMSLSLGIHEAGRYRVQWRTQIGMGDNPTEHNDVWLRFPDADDFYGKKGADPETRRYPKPLCEDAAAMAAIEALPEVSEASCAQGSTKEGWMKVYSSGATAWKWSTNTSDNDAHGIYVEFAEAGVYTIEFSARADFMLLDRVVLHREDVDDEVVRAPDQAETPCD